MQKVTMNNGVQVLSFGSAQYVKAAVNNVEEYLTKQGESLPAGAKSPLFNGYFLDIDTSDEIGPDDASYYQSLIGIIMWMVDLLHIDIFVEVLMLLLHLDFPRKGHLGQLFHIFLYLKKHHNDGMPFNITEPEIDDYQFET